MKVNRRISESARKMKELEIEMFDIKILLGLVYTSPLIEGKRGRLGKELEKFHIVENPKRILYFEDSSNSREVNRKFIRQKLYGVLHKQYTPSYVELGLESFSLIEDKLYSRKVLEKNHFH